LAAPATERIFVAGHRGMAGSAIVRALLQQGASNKQILTRSRDELNLCNQQAVEKFFNQERPTQVYLAAAKVGGIHANNTYPADFIYQNLVIQTNVVHSAFQAGVKKLLFLGSSCIYPRHALQPMAEEALLTSPLEPTNEPYAIAKIAGIKLCESYNRQYGASHGLQYRSVMPTNLYGPGDNYHPENSHVIPALLRRFHEARVAGQSEVTLWGSGKPRREFLYVDDMANACVFTMNLPETEFKAQTEPMRSHLNVGFGSDVSIMELGQAIAKTCGFKGAIALDPSRPDGPMQKLMNSKRLNQLGWKPKVSLEEGLALAYEDFLKNLSNQSLRVI
jgi:GDP-L-fucose synthase